MQSEIASRLIDSLDSTDPGHVSLVTLVETMRVLARAYGLDRSALEAVVEGLLRSREHRGDGERAALARGHLLGSRSLQSSAE